MDSATLLGEIAHGATAGAAFGPAGMAAGAVVAVASGLADAAGVTRWLFGEGGAETQAAVAAAVERVTGTADLAEQAATLASAPAAALQLRVALAEIAARRQSEADAAAVTVWTAQLSDVSDARHQTLQLAAVKSLAAWGAPVVSIVTLVSYAVLSGMAVWMTMHGDLPPNTVAILSVILGAASAMAASVVSYWVGSSAGSLRKDDALARLTKPPA